MAGCKRCINGHYFQGDHCPYCTTKGGVRISNDSVFFTIGKDANDLRRKTDVVLEFDYAPDGIKRYLEIKRKCDGLWLKSDIARKIGCSEKDISAEINLKIFEIDRLVNSELLKKNIYPIRTFDNASLGDWYVSKKVLSSIVSDTLMTCILGRGSKLDLLYKEKNMRRTPSTHTVVNTAACASFGDKGFQKAKKEVESKKYLSISLADNSKKVMSIPEMTANPCAYSVEDFISEDIAIYKPNVVVKEYGKPDLVFDYNKEEYSDCMKNIANKGKQSVYFRVSRQQVAIVLFSLSEKLSALHKQGIIHCDLKPQNILSLRSGLVPFDGIYVKNGNISAGMTENYCAPEQILTMPVSPATDIYNLGLLVLTVVDGILYGKISSYIIPTGGAGANEVRLLTDPMVYIDYETSNIENVEGLFFWKSFLEKCLAFDARNRFPDIDSFMNEYKRLLDLYPLKGYMEFSPDFGRLEMVNNNGQFDLGWFISAE